MLHVDVLEALVSVGWSSAWGERGSVRVQSSPKLVPGVCDSGCETSGLPMLKAKLGAEWKSVKAGGIGVANPCCDTTGSRSLGI